MNLNGEVPDVGHLVLITGKGTGIAIPPRSTMLIVGDPSNLGHTVPLILTKVTRDKISFRCACGNSECTRVIEYQMQAKGFHPSR